jgi:hypothetical protein
MKIIIKALLLLIVPIAVSCDKKINKSTTAHDNLNSKYNPDSVYYHIDVLWDENDDKELFLITSSLYVKDSCFGVSSNHDNWKNAWAYMGEKYPDMRCPDFLYRIFFFGDGKFNEFSSVSIDADYLTYPVLRQGEFTSLSKIAPKKLAWESSVFLRIVEVSDSNIDSRNINLIYKNKKWIVFSKEKLRAQDKLYCLDTIQNDFSLKNFRFDSVFDSYNSEFHCNYD